MSTLTRPVGVRVNVTAPDTVKMPAALIVSAVSGSISFNSLKPAENSSVLAAELNFTRIAACSPASSMMPSPSSSKSLSSTGRVASGSSGRMMDLSTAWPELLSRTVIEPPMVSPSRPTKLASP